MNAEEHQRLLNIRNSDAVRLVSGDNKVISSEEHERFIDNLRSSDNRFYAVISDEKLFGGVNYFYSEPGIKWGLFFSDNTPLLVKTMVPVFLIDHLFTMLGDQYLYLDIRRDNHNAIAFDKQLGFKVFEENGDFLQMRMNRDTFETAKTGSLKRIVKKMKTCNIGFEEVTA